MPKVKIIWVQRFYLDDHDQREIVRHISDAEFEEITDEELAGLRRNLHALPRPAYDFEPKILLLDEKPIETHLGGVRELIRKQALAAEREVERQKEVAARRKQSREARERAKLNELKKKFGET